MKLTAVEMLYAMFLIVAFLFAVLLAAVATIQYYKLEERRNENINISDIAVHNGRYEYPGYSQSMGQGLDREPSYYILPYIPRDQYPRLYIRQAAPDRGSWAPIYYYPWNKHTRLDQIEPAIQAASWLYT